ncbi:MAG: hypothetical protein ACTSRA_04805 [Promethearchaeota archaeon]
MKRVRRTVVNRNLGNRGHKRTYQMRIDHLFFCFIHPIRISILKFLNRNRHNGPAQFMLIKRALESLDHPISTANLNYHLSALRKAGFIFSGNQDNTSSGYMITAIGRKLVEKYFELEKIFDEYFILKRNKLDNHLYRDEILDILNVQADNSYRIDIKIERKDVDTPIQRYLMKKMTSVKKSNIIVKKPKVTMRPTTLERFV